MRSRAGVVVRRKQPAAKMGLTRHRIMVKGETILSLGKNLVHMTAGQAYKIPPTDLSAHSNLNMGE